MRLGDGDAQGSDGTELGHRKPVLMQGARALAKYIYIYAWLNEKHERW
jgi:hypothetical protein